MSRFTVSADSPLPAPEIWAKVTDWTAHGRYVPFTSMQVTTPPPNGVGTVFVARTAVGPVGFDDPMEIVQWSPPTGEEPGSCRIEKRGRVMLGWAVLTVETTADGSRATWTEDARPNGLPRFASPLATLSGRMLFGRVLRRLVDA